jgi:hypothetical protein
MRVTNITRTDHRHADAERLDLHRQPLRHVDHGKFTRRVGAKSEPALQTGHRCGVDDVAAFAMGANMREEGSEARPSG